MAVRPVASWCRVWRLLISKHMPQGLVAKPAKATMPAVQPCKMLLHCLDNEPLLVCAYAAIDVACWVVLQLSTRLFGHNRRGGMLCPLLDMANHHFNCPNSYRCAGCLLCPVVACQRSAGSTNRGNNDTVHVSTAQQHQLYSSITCSIKLAMQYLQTVVALVLGSNSRLFRLVFDACLNAAYAGAAC